MHLGNTFSRVIIFRKRVLHLIKAFLLAFLFKKKKNVRHFWRERRLDYTLKQLHSLGKGFNFHQTSLFSIINRSVYFELVCSCFFSFQPFELILPDP